MKILQFIPFGPVPLMQRLLAQAARTNQYLPILDLEDTHWDIRSSDNTARRKDKARDCFIELTKTAIQEGNAKTTIAIRSNHPSSADFSKDILTIKQLATSFELYALLLPKTSSASDMQNAKNALSEIGQAQIKIIPIIENERGLKRIQEISDAAAAMGNEHICYGHYDYHLDTGSWPFPSIHDPKFWETAQVVIEEAMKAGLIYIQPPFADLHNSVTLAEIINHLAHHCEDRFHLLSAGPSQTPILTKLVSAATRRPNSMPITTSHARELSSKEKDRLAEDIREAFVQSKRSQHSFTTDASATRFITPHEYAAALRYIEQREYA